jgi:hypothetical protein
MASTKKPAKPLSVARWMRQTEGPVAALAAGIDDRLALLQSLQQVLPAAVSSHCLGAEIIRNQLKLFADTSAWATRIRFDAERLLQQARDTTQQPVESLQVRVIPNIPSPMRPRRQPKPQLSQTNAELIRSTAQYLDAPELRDALLRLAKHQK